MPGIKIEIGLGEDGQPEVKTTHFEGDSPDDEGESDSDSDSNELPEGRDKYGAANKSSNFVWGDYVNEDGSYNVRKAHSAVVGRKPSGLEDSFYNTVESTIGPIYADNIAALMLSCGTGFDGLADALREKDRKITLLRDASHLVARAGEQMTLGVLKLVDRVEALEKRIVELERKLAPVKA